MRAIARSLATALATTTCLALLPGATAQASGEKPSEVLASSNAQSVASATFTPVAGTLASDLVDRTVESSSRRGTLVDQAQLKVSKVGGLGHLVSPVGQVGGVTRVSSTHAVSKRAGKVVGESVEYRLDATATTVEQAPRIPIGPGSVTIAQVGGKQPCVTFFGSKTRKNHVMSCPSRGYLDANLKKKGKQDGSSKWDYFTHGQRTEFIPSTEGRDWRVSKAKTTSMARAGAEVRTIDYAPVGDKCLKKIQWGAKVSVDGKKAAAAELALSGTLCMSYRKNVIHGQYGDMGQEISSAGDYGKTRVLQYNVTTRVPQGKNPKWAITTTVKFDRRLSTSVDEFTEVHLP